MTNCTEDALTFFLVQASLNLGFAPLVELGPEQVVIFRVAPSQAEVTISGFEKGNTYYFRITAENLVPYTLNPTPCTLNPKP